MRFLLLFSSISVKRGAKKLKNLLTEFFNLFSNRDFIVITFFTILGMGGVFAAGLVTLTPTESQGAGYISATTCDPAVTINKDIVFDFTTKRYVLTTISISDVDQRYQAGCGNMVMELVYPLNGDFTYASWTIQS